MKDLGIIAFINAKYQRYVPLFAYTVFRSYPSYSIRVLMQGRMRKEIAEVCNKASKLGDLTIRDGMFRKFSPNDQYFKSLRWTYYDEQFDEFDNIYIGDVDMMICKENPSLLDQHLADCKDKDLPYSNVVRVGQKRLVGRHFMTRDYFVKMKPVMSKYLDKLRTRSIRLKENVKGNEWLLYRMVRQSGIGFSANKTDKTSLLTTHHGIHLGIWRNASRKPSNDVSFVLHKDFFQQYLKMKKDKLYQSIYEVTPLFEIPRMEMTYREFLGV